MRKDVKIGLSIGGILLAVLIVYALVPKGETSQYSRQGDGSNGAVDPQNGGGTGLNPATSDSRVPSGQGGVTDGAQNGTGGTQRVATTDTGTNTGAGTGAIADADAGSTNPKSIDWRKILETGVVPDDAKVALAAPGAANRGTPDDVFAEPQNGSTNGNGVNNDINWNTQGGHGPTGTPAVKGQAPTASRGNTTGATGARSTPKEHVIQQGENLSSISLAAYGDAKHYKEILKANPTLDERKLKPGTKIIIPDASTFTTAGSNTSGNTSAKAQPAAAKQEAAIDPAKEYRIEQGDSLHKIAMKLYGKATMADTLYELNKEKIGDDSSRVKIGMVIKLPQAPTVSTSTPHAAR